MAVTIHIPEPLRRYSDGADAIDVVGDTVGEAFGMLFDVFPELQRRVIDSNEALFPYLILMVGDREVERHAWRDAEVEEGEIVSIIPAVEGGMADVRMRGFEKRATVDAARREALADIDLAVESVAAAESAGRVLAEDVASTVDVPPFDRSAMDGYAVVASATFGATRDDPITLRIVGESMPGSAFGGVVDEAAACSIMTGAPLPEGADAVVMAEDVALAGEDAVLVEAPVTPGKNVGRRGEDIASGSVVLQGGRRLRPQDAAILCSIGAEARVVRRPRVGVLVTGNELLPPGERPRDGRIVDSNTPMLEALAARDGADVRWSRRLADDPEMIRATLSEGGIDLLLCAGGSSVGREDWLPILVSELGELPIHGVAMRPSAPTGLGRIDGRRVFLLPGNPVSCLCAYDFFAGPAIRSMAGRSTAWPYPRLAGRLARRISSVVGRVDYVRVEVHDEAVTPLATSGASILSSTTRADGFCVVPEDSEGLAEDAEVEVFLYDGSQS